mmetsp:Transcript_43860/g.79305  ORF Transcript_43860/g.79305 Transcript_43860/m.79305 type:complete len:220 (-) Transcript_43860:111-770(-)
MWLQGRASISIWAFSRRSRSRLLPGHPGFPHHPRSKAVEAATTWRGTACPVSLVGGIHGHRLGFHNKVFQDAACILDFPVDLFLTIKVRRLRIFLVATTVNVSVAGIARVRPAITATTATSWSQRSVCRGQVGHFGRGPLPSPDNPSPDNPSSTWRSELWGRRGHWHRRTFAQCGAKRSLYRLRLPVGATDGERWLVDPRLLLLDGCPPQAFVTRPLRV